MSSRCLGSLLSLSLSVALGACATGVEDEGLTSISGPYGGPADGGGTEGETDSDEDDGPVPPGATSEGPADGSGGDDDMGNPLCCEVHPTAGCESAATESCVCAVSPSCCQSVWTEECVEQAISCGDPFCDGGAVGDTGGDPPPDDSGDPPPDDSGDPPPGDSGDPPPPPPASCDCLGGVDNFCLYGPNYPDCPMTHPGGYCDPNGDGSFEDGDWEMGYYDYLAACT